MNDRCLRCDRRIGEGGILCLVCESRMLQEQATRDAEKRAAENEPTSQQTHLAVSVHGKNVEGFVGASIASNVWTFSNEPDGRAGLALNTPNGGWARIHFSENDGLRLAYAILTAALQKERERHPPEDAREVEAHVPRSQRARTLYDSDPFISAVSNGKVYKVAIGAGYPHRASVWITPRRTLEAAVQGLDILIHGYTNSGYPPLSNHERKREA